MSLLTLNCLGALTISLNGIPISGFRTDKVRALLAFLALDPRAHRREKLARLLWSDMDEAQAQKNLRNTLHRLRQTLNAVEPELGERVLQVDRQSVALDSNPCAIDVQKFRQLVATSAAHRPSSIQTHGEHVAECDECIATLLQATELYRGELLAGFSLTDAPAFEEWLLLQREELQQQALSVLLTLSTAHHRRAEWESAERFARQALRIEPWREEAHRLLMRSLAQSGQRSAALAQYQRCQDELRTGLNVEPEPETTALYQQIRSGDFAHPHTITASNAQSSAALLSATPPHNLPAAMTPFVGRIATQTEVVTHLQRRVRLLTLIGVGGMGKTRLALEVGAQLLPAYPDGVWFVSLAAVSSASMVANTIAGAVGISIQGGDPRAILCQQLQSKHMLLILDNVEHLLVDSDEAATLVSELLQAAPKLQILATSRARLNLRGEQLLQVPPMSLASKDTLEEAGASSAVKLFVQSAQFAQADFQLSMANLHVVLRICQLVHGMPLALELAAAQVSVFPLHMIADEIATNIEFLSADWHDLPERQRGMRAVFNWSWQLLTLEEQRALRRVSVFQGGFDRSAALVVADTTLPILTSLVHKSLLQWQETNEGSGRYAIHELLRQFAAEALTATSERADIEERHGTYYLSFVVARGYRLGRHEPKEASAEIQAELDNVRQAWQWALQERRICELDKATYGWWQFCQFRGLLLEGWQTFSKAVATTREQLGNCPEGPLRQRYQQVLSKLIGIELDFHPAIKAAEMAERAQEAIALGRASNCVVGVALATFEWANAQQALRQKAAAGEAWEQVIQLAAQHQLEGDEQEILYEAQQMAQHWLRGYWLGQDDYPRGRRCMEAAVELCQSLGKKSGELINLVHLGWTDLFMGNIPLAEQEFSAALNLTLDLGYLTVEMLARHGLGIVLQLRGEYQQAQLQLERALPIARQVMIVYFEAWILSSLIRLYTLMGLFERVAVYIKQSQTLLATKNLPSDIYAQNFSAYAFFARHTGDHQQALKNAEQSLTYVLPSENIHRRADAFLELGHVQLALQQWDNAIASYNNAIGGYQSIGNTTMMLEAQAGLAHSELMQGNLTGALTQVEKILPTLAFTSAIRCNTPFPIYLSCYQTLAAKNDSRADSVLQRGHDLLQTYAARLDVNTRTHFLKSVHAHRQILEFHHAAQQRMIVIPAQAEMTPDLALTTP